ncbi:MAG: oligoendopeptidase F [candidate division Zixibacteria bacterium HGW-Zixibacteria-1]|nr:MAG: oligoendopeptidase F [candidate division Zixibacteria bacterium HGW-Zixibacteria-1]
MSSEVKQAPSAIPQREDIEEKYKWNLNDIYRSEADWEIDYKKAQNLIEKAKDYSGKLAASAKLLYECLDTRSSLGLICFNLYQYAKLNQDLDNRVSRYQAMTERAAMLSAQAGAAYSFVEPELLNIDDDKLKVLAGKFPKTDIYDFYIQELIRSRKHIRSAEVEELLAQSQIIARGPEKAFSMLDDADLTYQVIKDENGNDVQLTKQRYAKFMESPLQVVRKAANDGFIASYEKHLNTIGATLSASVNKDVFYSRARRHESCLHASLDAFNIPVSVYHGLIENTEKNLEALHKWIHLRKKILKLDDIYPYDVYCPLFPDQNYHVKYNDAVKQVLEAVKPLGEKYVSVMKDGFEKRWIDVFETEGKSSGAFSWGNYSAHPFVMMNYNDTVDNMFTLAHEMGHCLHSFMSNKTQPYPKAQYSIFVAEVASTLNEGLLLKFLLDRVSDVKQKLFLLNRHIDNTLGTFFHQVMYAHFELMIHEMVEKGEALSPDLLNEMWEKLTRKYYGSGLTLDKFAKFKWSRIPHFYRAYYVFQYATSHCASQAILDKFLTGEKGLIEKYLALLSSGGSDYPVNQLKKCGVDMTTPEPVKATLKLFAEQVDEVEKLA